MKVFAMLLLAGAAGAEPLTLVSTLPDRPVFNIVSNGSVQSRSVAPLNRISLEPGTFSGLGLKSVPLAGGQIYYLARFGALPSLYVLPPDQFLILNQSGRPVDLTIDGVTAPLASGGFALGKVSQTVSWDAGTHSLSVEGGKVYRLQLTSPEGVGTAITLSAW